jgi:hypothetical protein
VTGAVQKTARGSWLRGRRSSALAPVLALISCGRAASPPSPDAPVASSGAPLRAVSDASSPPSFDAGVTAPRSNAPDHDASQPEASSPAPAFSLAGWLTEHTISGVDHDSECAIRALPADEDFGLASRCICAASLTLASQPPVDMLVCRRGIQRNSGPVDNVTQTLLYAPVHGRLRLVLDVTTDASTGYEHIPEPGRSDEQNADWLNGNDVHIGVRAEGDRIAFFDRGDGPIGSVVDPRYTCAQTTARVGTPRLAGEQSLNASEIAVVKRTYRAICDAQGQWRWTGAAFARVPPISR